MMKPGFESWSLVVPKAMLFPHVPITDGTLQETSMRPSEQEEILEH